MTRHEEQREQVFKNAGCNAGQANEHFPAELYAAVAQQELLFMLWLHKHPERVLSCLDHEPAMGCRKSPKQRCGRLPFSQDTLSRLPRYRKRTTAYLIYYARSQLKAPCVCFH